MTDKIREVADGILAAMRHADPRPWDNRTRNRRLLGNGETRPTGKRKNRHRRKTSDQIKALCKLGWPAGRIAKLSEQAATTIIAKGREYDRDAEVARARLQEIDDDPTALVQGDELKARLDKLTARPQRGEEGRTDGAGGKKETPSVPLARPSGAHIDLKPQNRGDDDMKEYSRKPNARLAARKELGAQAKEGIDYRLVSHGGGIRPQRWGWERIGTLPRRKAGAAAVKMGTLKALLARKGGVTLVEIGQDTGWLTHTAKARICELRKAGAMIETIKASGKETKYRATVAQR